MTHALQDPVSTTCMLSSSEQSGRPFALSKVLICPRSMNSYLFVHSACGAPDSSPAKVHIPQVQVGSVKLNASLLRQGMVFHQYQGELRTSCGVSRESESTMNCGKH
jgi:hypothetical protein